MLMVQMPPKNVVEKYRGQSYADLPFATMNRAESFKVQSLEDLERVLALAVIAGEELGKRFFCVDGLDGLVVMCKADQVNADATTSSAAEAKARDRCVLRLDMEQYLQRARDSQVIYPLRELAPGDYFAVEEKHRHQAARTAASQLAVRVPGLRFRCLLDDDGWLIVQRVDDGATDPKAMGRRGRPTGFPETATGEFRGLFSAGSRYPFDLLDVGDWFTVQGAGESFRANCSTKAKRHSIRVSCREYQGVMHVIRIE